MARTHYDKELPTLKTGVALWLAQSSGDSLEPDEIPPAVQELRKTRDAQDKERAALLAKKTLEAAAKRSHPVSKRTKQWNLKSDERELFKKVLRDPMNLEMAADNLQDRVLMADTKGDT